MDPENDPIVIADEDTTEEDFSQEELEDDSIDWKAKAEELKGIAKRRATQLKKLKDAGYKKPEPKAPKSEPATKKPPVQSKTDELDETQLDFLDLKGITDADDIAIVESVFKKTGQTVRQILADDYVQAKLKSNADKRAVKDATPANQKRSGGGPSDDLAAALAKYEATHELPADFALRSAVVNAFVAKSDSNKPGWAS